MSKKFSPNKGFHGFKSDDEAFLEVSASPWDAAGDRGSDDDGHVRGANWNDSDDHGLVDKLSDDATASVHERLSRLLDRQADQPSGPMLTGGGAVSDNERLDDATSTWKGSDRKGPRYAAKSGPIGNMKRPK